MASVNLLKSNFCRKLFMKERKFKSLHPGLYFFSIQGFNHVISVEPDPFPKSLGKLGFFCLVYLWMLAFLSLEVLLGDLHQ